ncbi:MAG: hypothetical protein HGA36_04190 [Candidatus Moranbacteria bacterium]|nr:hypothetical protein [Candidatus Moranbacteria bacterium]
MFDFTKQVILPNSLQKKYQVARAILHLFFLFIIVFIAYEILFPIVSLTFSLDNPTSKTNNLIMPVITRTNAFPENGKLLANDTLLDNANPIGQFAKADVTLVKGKNGKSIDNAKVEISRSYQAFRYPLGEPVGFKDGTLLTTATDGAYYIVSDGKLRKFSNTDIILKFGYPKDAFITVQASDLKYNQLGAAITNNDTYPADTLFVINNNHYQLQDGKLLPFVSTQAFLTNFDNVAAIAKNDDFFASYPASEQMLGFADGTLVSIDFAVYIVSELKKYPVMNPETFVAMGFNWDDIIAINQNEISIYEKQKQFTHDDPHPNGTIFVDQKTSQHFIVENETKRPILSDPIVKTYSKQKPVLANLEGLEKGTSCTLKKQLFNANSFTCSLPLDEMTTFPGNDYQIKMTSPVDTTLNTISLTFSTPVTPNNMMISLGKIKAKIINR